jgi:glyoxylase-like metal-dependent hydrolase (beta-lactamase superfamily II)
MTVYTYPIGPLLTNCYIVTARGAENRALVIDPAFGAEKILGFLESKGLRLDGVLLTHCHFDHMGAVDGLCKEGVPFYCSLADAPALEDPRKNGSAYFGKEVTVKTVPTKLLREGDVLSLGEERLTVLETPGHTEGSICLVSDELLFSGDTLFFHGYGRTDLYGGSDQKIASSLRRILSLEERTVYPGHGKATSVSSEKSYFGL